MKEEGYILYEHFDGQRYHHFRNRTAKRLDVAICRIHDLCRSYKFIGQREFSIWNALTPVMKVFAYKDETGKVSYVQKAYLLPAIRYTVRKTNGEKVVLDNKLGIERDYYMATKYRRNMTIGKRAGDLTDWIKSAKRSEETATKVDKVGYILAERVIERRFGN